MALYALQIGSIGRFLLIQVLREFSQMSLVRWQVSPRNSAVLCKAAAVSMPGPDWPSLNRQIIPRSGRDICRRRILYYQIQFAVGPQSFTFLSHPDNLSSKVMAAGQGPIHRNRLFSQCFISAQQIAAAFASRIDIIIAAFRLRYI